MNSSLTAQDLQALDVDDVLARATHIQMASAVAITTDLVSLVVTAAFPTIVRIRAAAGLQVLFPRVLDAGADEVEKSHSVELLCRFLDALSSAQPSEVQQAALRTLAACRPFLNSTARLLWNARSVVLQLRTKTSSERVKEIASDILSEWPERASEAQNVIPMPPLGQVVSMESALQFFSVLGAPRWRMVAAAGSGSPEFVLESGVQALGPVLAVAGVGQPEDPKLRPIGAVVRDNLSSLIAWHLQGVEHLRTAEAFVATCTEMLDLASSEGEMRPRLLVGDLDESTRVQEGLEGMLRAALDSYERKKVPHLGKFFARYVFSPAIDHEQAHHVLSLARQLSYRQFCMISLFKTERQSLPNVSVRLLGDDIWKKYADTQQGQNLRSMLQEAFNLTTLGLLERDDSSSLLDFTDVDPSKMVTSELGDNFFRLLALEQVESDSLRSLRSSVKAISMLARS